MAVIAATTALCSPAAWGQGGPPPKTVYVARVELRELQEQRRVTGELRAVSRSTVATIEPGLVLSAPADEGATVKAGEVLAVLDSRRLALQLLRLKALQAVADAAVEIANAELELKQRDLESLLDLKTRGASNPKETADAESEFRIATAELNKAERDVEAIAAQAALLDARNSDMTIRAPFDGLVLERLTEQGQWVAEGDGIVELITTNAYEAWLDVPQRHAAALADPSAMILVKVDATGRLFDPARPVVIRQVNKTGRSFKIFTHLDDPDGVLADGMSVTGWIPTGQRDTYLTIPRDALMRNEIGFYVYAARHHGEKTVAMPVQVTTMFQVGVHTVIRAGGLNHNDLVVVEGNERLYPTAAILFDAPPADGDAQETAAHRGS